MDLSTKRATDCYQLLDVDRTATKEQIQKAFMLKASIWHPDKASDNDRDHYESVYSDIQTAYKILSDDNTRKQYTDSQQTTDLEFKFAERNNGYNYSNKFNDENGLFDQNAFNQSFINGKNDNNEFINLNKTVKNKEKIIHNQDIQNFMNLREQQEQDLKQQKFFGDFNNDNFNKVFDIMKDIQPGNALQPYEGDPTGLSSSGLEELQGSSIDLPNINFTAKGIEDIVTSHSSNPTLNMEEVIKDRLKNINDQTYGKEETLTESEIQQKIDKINEHRQNLSQINDFIIKPSEIESMYPDLYAPLELEGITSKSSESENTSDNQSSTDVLIKRDSNKIRKKINEKKNA